jgi:predicted transcriptional regulator
MTALDGRGWRLARRVTALLAEESALTTADLAAKLGVTEAELTPVVGMLIGRGLVERCAEYLTVPLAHGGPS